MKLRQQRPLILLLAALVIIAAAWSFVIFHPSSASQNLDERTRAVASQLKCPICQGESVADSPSYLAQEMRHSIRAQLQAGRSEQQVIQYFEARYGEQIVWSPPTQGFDLLAWVVPIGLLLSGTALILLVLHDWGQSAPLLTGKNEQVPEVKEAEGEETDSELDPYRQQLEEELAAEDPLFQNWKRGRSQRTQKQIRPGAETTRPGTEIS